MTLRMYAEREALLCCELEAPLGYAPEWTVLTTSCRRTEVWALFSDSFLERWNLPISACFLGSMDFNVTQ